MTTATSTLVWDDRFREYDFGPEHPFQEASRWLGVRLLDATVAARSPAALSLDRISRVEPASPEILRRFHRDPYLLFVHERDRSDRREPLDQGDTPGFPGCYGAAARIVQGTVLGAERVLDGPHRAFNPGGGLHHAHPDRASGFCIFNDLAVAIRTLVGQHRRRVAYVDIDAHHGDGVMYGFYDDGNVLDIDFHQDGRTLFPGTGAVLESGRGDGAGLKINLPLPPLAGDEAFGPLFERVVPTAIERFRPDVIVLQHGVDAHAGDPLAQLQLTSVSYRQALETLLALAQAPNGPRLLVTGGGGYSAKHVSRTLAYVGLRLAEISPTGTDADVELPAAWRAEFAATVGEGAPEGWDDRGSLYRSPWGRERTEKLLRSIESEVGYRFAPSR